MGGKVQRDPSYCRTTYPRRRPAPQSPPISPRTRPPRRRAESQASRFISPPAPPPHGVGPPDPDAARHGAPPSLAQNGPLGEIARAG